MNIQQPAKQSVRLNENTNLLNNIEEGLVNNLPVANNMTCWQKFKPKFYKFCVCLAIFLLSIGVFILMVEIKKIQYGQ
jgi:hypothetical protein